MSPGRDIPLIEAGRLIRNGGRYTDDVAGPCSLHAAFVRSQAAHAVITSVDISQALAMDGVECVSLQSDLDRFGAGAIRVGWAIAGQRQTKYDLLARDRVRFVGEPLAVVLARDRYVAEDAATRVVVGYEPLPVVLGVEQAVSAQAPLLYPEWGDNVLARWTFRGGDADAVFAGPAVTVSARFRHGRAIPTPIEPRGARVRYDRFRGGLEVTGSFQSAHHVQAQLAEAVGCPVNLIRVIPPDVGGSFGVKDHLPSEVGVIAVLAKALRRDTTWIEDRRENLQASPHSRGQTSDVELAADADARILAIRGTLWFDAGAASGAHGIGTALYSGSMVPGPYDFSAYRLEVIGVVTNKVPSAAYRGYGGPEATFVIEGLVDRLARKVGLDPAEVRRRNLIPADAFPYRNAAGLDYDHADHQRVLREALELADYDAIRSSTGPGSVSGVGIACVVQRGGFGPSQPAIEAGMIYGGFETAAVRMDASGSAVVLTGISSQGQGVNTAMSQICADQLGIEPDQVTVLCGDTAVTPYSPVGAIASRGVAVGGSAVHRAAGELGEKLRASAALVLEAAASDIELKGGFAHVRGSGEARVAIGDVAASLLRGEHVPSGMDPGLEVIATYEPCGETTSYGAHVAIVRVDRATGHVCVERYVCVTDCGTMINPGIVEGQVVGAVVQGIGGALFEDVRLTDDGVPLYNTLMEYRLPTAADVPTIETRFVETPTPVTHTGARGVGEVGINGPAAAIANAVADALGPSCEPPSEIPMTPDRIWLLINPTDSLEEGSDGL